MEQTARHKKRVLKIIRSLLGALVFFGGSLILFVLACFKPFDPRMAMLWCRWLPPLAFKLMGIQVEVRRHHIMKDSHPCIIIGNHQHALDLFVHGSMVCEPTVAIGKQEVKYIPFFGWIFWITGMVFINRQNRHSAIETMAEVAKIVNRRGVSVYIFPEGTRARRKPLLPFKKGAFHLAISAQLPLVPVVASNFHKSLDLNRWNSGKVIVEVLEPIETRGKTAQDVESLIALAHSRMKDKIEELDRELA